MMYECYGCFGMCFNSSSSSKKTFLAQFITVLPRGKMNKLWEKLVGLRVGGNYEHD